MKYLISIFFHREVAMVTVTFQLDPAVAGFYQRIASAAQLPLETVLADTLFKLAAELSLEALQQGR